MFSSAVSMIIFKGVSSGNTHIPFSSFPYYLVWVPIFPIDLVCDTIKVSNLESMQLLTIFVLVFIGLLFLSKLLKKGKKKERF